MQLYDFQKKALRGILKEIFINQVTKKKKKKPKGGK